MCADTKTPEFPEITVGDTTPIFGCNICGFEKAEEPNEIGYPSDPSHCCGECLKKTKRCLYCAARFLPIEMYFIDLFYDELGERCPGFYCGECTDEWERGRIGQEPEEYSEEV